MDKVSCQFIPQGLTDVAGAWPIPSSWPLHHLRPLSVLPPAHTLKLQLLNFTPRGIPLDGSNVNVISD